MNNYRIDNLQYCNWSKEIFKINNEAKLDAVHVTIAYHEDFSEVKKNDIIICTALIPGKNAPRIISEEMVKSMKPGSIIYDLAVNQGGNSAFSEPDKVNIINGVKIVGSKNILNNLSLTASSLYAKNLYNFVRNLYSKEKKDIYINLEDEIISETLIKKEL